jgi:nucleotide-binding universal stress UspA family protein
MVLICYDGSADARAAITDAGRCLPGHPAVVLTVWVPLAEVLIRTPAGTALLAGLSSSESGDEESEAEAQRMADEGAELARAAGFDASPRICAQSGAVADTIIAQADRANATAIVMGSRGRTGLQSLLGSVSHSVVQRSDRAVMVVPSAGVAAERRDRLHQAEGERQDAD